MADKKKQRSGHWLLWWIVDKAELASQVAGYRSRGLFKTARGVACFCLLLSVAITVGFVALKITPVSSALDAGVSLVLAAFIYFGHRWAMLAAMAWWTLEKVVGIVGVFQGPALGGVQAFTQVIWWCIYMHAFWLAFRVEQARRRPSATPVSVFD